MLSLNLKKEEVFYWPRVSEFMLMCLYDFPFYFPCDLRMTFLSGTSEESNVVLKLMGAYLVFAFTGFVLILVFLEKIGAKSDPEKPCLQVRI